MFKEVLVTSNFPDVLSRNVEYTVSFQLLLDEKIEETLYYVFSDKDIIKRVDKLEERKTFFYDDVSLTFSLKDVGSHTFSLVLGKKTIFTKNFVVDEVLDSFLYIFERKEPYCFQRPENILVDKMNNTFTFNCYETFFDEWLKFYHKYNIKCNNKIYCGIRYFAPSASTHWRIITNNQDSGYMEFTTNDESMVDWYFPVAILEDETVSISEKTYKQSIGFYVKYGNEYVELDYNVYDINISPLKKQKCVNTNEWDEEVLRLIYFTHEGYQTKDLIRKYGAWHSLSEEEILSDIRKFKDNFGEFALHKGLIKTETQATLLNYATHYTLIDSIIKLGITDLKQTREDFQELMLQAKKGICEVLPKIQ